eukprot:TRINITY_DN1138_c0_g1_i6.p1 TRINITY_DN1138_c0_g1~~TRINITY_DN1138_c0_g1_i6.p1  ORF type:complete len:216 (+),score=13.76 TRINITY_DN1138_c0_g1_i6:417-1064(+)
MNESLPTKIRVQRGYGTGSTSVFYSFNTTTFPYGSQKIGNAPVVRALFYDVPLDVRQRLLQHEPPWGTWGPVTVRGSQSSVSLSFITGWIGYNTSHGGYLRSDSQLQITLNAMGDAFNGLNSERILCLMLVDNQGCLLGSSCENFTTLGKVNSTLANGTVIASSAQLRVCLANSSAASVRASAGAWASLSLNESTMTHVVTFTFLKVITMRSHSL